MKKKLWMIVLLAVTVGALGFGYTAYRAQRKLVTLDVRDMDVREIVRKMERQTWEDIFVNKDVSGKVTMNVRNMPLEGALEIVSEQTSSRWSLMYPLYSTKQSLGNFKKAVTGEIKAEDAGWKALRFGGFRMAGGFFGESSRNDNQLVTLKLEGKSLEAVAGAVSRFTRAQVVPEDGSSVTMSVDFSDTPVADAVDQLAKKASRKWTRYYALQGSRFGPGGPRRDFARDGESNTNAPGTNEGGWFGRGPEMSEEARKRFEEQLSTLSPEERQKMEERRRQMEEMRKMSPEDRANKMREMAKNPEFQERMQGRMMNGIKNTTPEQRAERDQRMNQMRKRWGH